MLQPGRPGWRDIIQLRQDLQKNIFDSEARSEAKIRAVSEQAYMARERLEGQVNELNQKVDGHDSMFDQQKGAKNLIYFLIGSNLLALISTGLLFLSVVASSSPQP